MNNLSVFLGIDIGTTAIKFGVIENGSLVFETSIKIITYGNDVKKYQDKSEIISVLEKGIYAIPEKWRRKADKIGFSSAMHSLLPEKHHEIFLWSDLQAQDVIAKFARSNLAKRFYQLSGTPIHAMSPFAKLLYFKLSNKFQTVKKWYGLKELVLEYFTGRFIIDRSCASATGYYDLYQQKWSEEILAYIGIKEYQLAKIVDTTDVFEMLPEQIKKFGFSQNIQVIAGASDGTLAAYASFYHTKRSASLTIGTSAAVRQISTKIKLEPKQQNFCYYLNEKYFVIGAPSNNGACLLEWSALQLSQNSTEFYKQLPDLLKRTSVGARGLRFFPYLNGERAPLWDQNVKGGFYDLTLQHTRDELLRSVIEGMLLNIRRLVKLVAPSETISVSGGFFQTSELAQLASDVFGAECFYAVENEPIFGLYYLYFQPDIFKEDNGAHFIPDTKIQVAYEKLSQNYFE